MYVNIRGLIRLEVLYIIRSSLVQMTQTYMRDGIDRMSDPLHVVVASMLWKATIQNIGLPFNCRAGVEDPVAVWTSWVPVVADSKLYLHDTHTRLTALFRHYPGKPVPAR